jgi:hypothetical protein
LFVSSQFNRIPAYTSGPSFSTVSVENQDPQFNIKREHYHSRSELWQPKEVCERVASLQKEQSTKEVAGCTFKPKAMSKASQEMVEGLKPWDERLVEFQRRKNESLEQRKQAI